MLPLVILLGIAAGSTDTFLFLRKHALLSDAISHATLPGVCLAIIVRVMLGGAGRKLVALPPGTAVSVWIALMCLSWLVHNTLLARDAATGPLWLGT